jgi:hypothetical protein
VHAELRIEHKAGDMHSRLVEAFGRDDRDVVDRSLLLSTLPAWKNLVAYGAEKSTLRLFCLEASNYELQLMIEPLIGGSIKDASETVWSAMRRSPRRRYKVRFLSLRVVDSASGQEIMIGRPGFRSNFASTQVWPAIAIGLVSAVWLGISLSHTTDKRGLVLGAIPALVLGALALLWLVFTRKRLAWSV